MADPAPRRLRRGVVAVAVVVVAALVVGGVLFARSRQVTRSVAALCTELGAAQDLDQAFTTLDPATLDPQVKALDEARQVAPADIEPSVATLARFVGDVADAVDSADADRQAALADALEARQGDIDAITAAGTSVQQWAEANCGLALAGTTSTTSTTVPTSSTP